MKNKICTKCKIEKSLDEFGVEKRVNDGKSAWCKQCYKKYRVEHKEERKIYNKKYNKENKDKLCVQHKKWHSEHREECKISKHEYYLKNKERFTVQNKKYQEDHKEEKKLYDKEYRKRRCETDIRYKIKCNLKTRVRLAIKNNNKSLSTMFLIGCEVDFLIYYLQSQFTDGMSWDNHGDWHIDHIKPCKLFDLSKPEQQQKCFNYKNLQPLWAKDNLSKGAKYNKEITNESI